MKLHLVDLWQCRVQYLRPYYASWKPRQRDHPISSPHVWYLPLVWTCWCTAMAAIILLALNVEDMMETVSAVQNLNFALYINSPLIVIWWRFAVMMSEKDSNSRCYKSKQRYCNCSICSHRWLRNGCVLTRLAKQGLPVTMVIPPLKQKCCQKRRVKFILHSADNPRVISILLMLAGDVESNPGPDYQEYVSVLPRSSCSFLKETLDWDNGGVDKDLTDIAAHLLDWEVKLSIPFGFTQSEIADLKEEHSKNPILLRRAVLRLWKEKQGLHATYEKLLKVCCEAGATTVAQAICEVLKQRAKDCCDPQSCSLVTQDRSSPQYTSQAYPPIQGIEKHSQSEDHELPPGTKPESGVKQSNAVHVNLGIDDLKYVFCEVMPAASVWNNIGLALGVTQDELDTINCDHPNDSKGKLKAVLFEWLRGNAGERTWTFLCAELRHNSVRRPALAEKIEAKYS